MNDFFSFTLVQAGTVVLAFGTFWVFFRKGGITGSQELIALYQAKDKEQKEIITESMQKIEQLTKDINFIKGVMTEKDKKLEEYLAIFQGRSPEQERYQQDMRQFTGEVAKYMGETLGILGELHKSWEASNKNKTQITTVTT